MQSKPLLELQGEVTDDKKWHSGGLAFYKTSNGSAYIVEVHLNVNRNLPYLSKQFTPVQLKQCPHRHVKFRSTVIFSLQDGTIIKFKSNKQSMEDLVSFLNDIKESTHDSSYQKTENTCRRLQYSSVQNQSNSSPKSTSTPRCSPVVKLTPGNRLSQNSNKLREIKDSDDFVLEIVENGKKSTELSPQGFFGSSGSSRNYAAARTPLKMLNSNTNQDSVKRPRQLDVNISKRPRLTFDVVENEAQDQPYNDTTTADKTVNNQSNNELNDEPVQSSPYNGFPNIGNSCFMNSVLQSLLQLRCISDNLDRTCNTLEKTLPGQSIIRYLLALLSCPPEDCPQILGQTLEVICHSSPCFADGQQHDALEFLIQLLDVIKEEVKKSSSDNDINVSNCPVTNNVEFQLGSSYVCEKCQRTISKKEVLHMLSLNVLNEKGESFSSLPDALRDYFEPQQIEMTCERCSFKSTKCIQGFSTLPRVLIFHLKRYTYSHGTCKIMCPIQVPTHLSVEEFLIDKAISSMQTSTSSPVQSVITVSKDTDALLPVLHSGSNSTQSSSEFQNDASPKLEGHLMNLKTIQGQQCLVQKGISLNGHRQGSPIALKGGSDSATATSSVPTIGSEVPFERNDVDTMDMETNTEDEELERILKMSAESSESQEDRELVEAMNRSIQDTQNDFLEDCESFEEDTCISKEDSRDDTENISGPFSYRLASVVSHIGQNADTGHYVANYFDPEVGQWWHFNDKTVQKRSKHSVLESIKTRGYLFFYVASDLSV